MGCWRKHQKKELEEVLQAFHDHGWRIEDPPTYYTVKCPCPAKHMRHIHLTPSDPPRRGFVQDREEVMSGLTDYRAEANLKIDGVSGEDLLEALADAVMDSLLEQERRSDGMVNSGAVSATLTTGDIIIEFCIRAGDQGEADRTAAGVLTTAMRHAGGMMVQDSLDAARTTLVLA